jgi:hypothetical protein
MKSISNKMLQAKNIRKIFLNLLIAARKLELAVFY